MTENNSVKDRKTTGFGFGSFFKSNKDKNDASSLGDYVTQTEYNEKIKDMDERLKTQEKYVSRLLRIYTKSLPFGGSKKTRKNKKSTKGKAKKTRRRS